MGKNESKLTVQSTVKPQVYNIRGKRVVLDRELAAAFGVETRVINQKVKRNMNLFNADSMFQLTFDECAELETSGSKSQNSGLSSHFVISNNTSRGGSRHLPFVFTEAGVQVLKTLMKSNVEIDFTDEPPLPAVYEKSWNDGTVVLYRPDETTDIDVYIYKETAWLRQEQISKLFGVKQPVISKHLSNIFQSGELEKNSVYSILEYTAKDGKTYFTAYYNLDAVLSVGYRVNSVNATRFRQWANRVLRNYILKGGNLENRVVALEEGLRQTNNIVYENQKQFDIVLKKAILPAEQIFMQGQFFDAYKLFSDLIRSAKERVIIIDNYVDESVLELLKKRKADVIGVIYTSEKCYNNNNFKLDLQRYNAQYPHIDVYPMSKVHDRFMIIDDVLYSSGGSFKDAGKKLFYFEKMGLNPDAILAILGK
ncbi:MAG: ORF6N domain-containing protein [Paludibacteraceae bacterium]|nr:ORF6N domain-containing protein [Paludibacteraceae bacterium]